MYSLWQAWFDAAQLTFEAQQVVALRMLRLAPGGACAAAESRRMVTEKAAAALASGAAAAAALASGQSPRTAAKRALTPYRQRVRRNRRRLVRRRK